METLAKKYQGKVDFLIIYCREAHPERAAQTNTWTERAKRANFFSRQCKTVRGILVDEFGDENIHEKYGGAEYYTGEIFVIDQQGRVSFKTCGDFQSLEKHLQELVRP